MANYIKPHKRVRSSGQDAKVAVTRSKRPDKPTEYAINFWVYNPKTDDKELHRLELTQEERDQLIKGLQEELKD